MTDESTVKVGDVVLVTKGWTRIAEHSYVPADLKPVRIKAITDDEVYFSYYDTDGLMQYGGCSKRNVYAVPEQLFKPDPLPEV